MTVWMALDPETLRVCVQAHEFSDGDLPRGLRGTGWKIRQGEIPDADYAEIIAGTIPGDEVDALHRDAWTAAGPTPWPSA